jgi:hypothetical protein
LDFLSLEIGSKVDKRDFVCQANELGGHPDAS